MIGCQRMAASSGPAGSDSLVGWEAPSSDPAQGEKALTDVAVLFCFVCFQFAGFINRHFSRLDSHTHRRWPGLLTVRVPRKNSWQNGSLRDPHRPESATLLRM